MKVMDSVMDAWNPAVARLNETPWFRRLRSGQVGVPHYKSYLRETYFHAGLNPQIQVAATMYFRDNPRKVIQRFYQHAISEIGHDLLALNDLAALGSDISKIPNERPLPSTTALNAFPLFEMQYRNPMAYVGYLFHLEFLPTKHGDGYMDLFRNAGVPDSALTFIKEHSEVDVAHNKFMELYLEQLIKTPEDLEAVIYGAVACCELHGNMISGAFEAAEHGRTNL